VKLEANRPEFWKEIEPLLENVEQIYFAGGEPLLMPEHYRLLDELIRRKSSVRLIYSANLTRLKNGTRDVIELWKNFEYVNLMASIDASGGQAEYIRAGHQWSEILRNRKRLSQECPHVNFFLYSALSILNAFSITRLHREWIEQGLVLANQCIVSLVHEPLHFCSRSSGTSEARGSGFTT